MLTTDNVEPVVSYIRKNPSTISATIFGAAEQVYKTLKEWEYASYKLSKYGNVNNLNRFDFCGLNDLEYFNKQDNLLKRDMKYLEESITEEGKNIPNGSAKTLLGMI